MNGAMRFGFFAAAIIAVGLGIYATNLNTKLENQNFSAAATATERDSWKAKFEQQQTKSAEDASALEQAHAQIKDLQAQLEEAKKPQTSTRRR